jgi:hypothetical protein
VSTILDLFPALPGGGRVGGPAHGAWDVSESFGFFRRRVRFSIGRHRGSLTVQGILRKFRERQLRGPSLGCEVRSPRHHPLAGVKPGTFGQFQVVSGVQQIEERAHVSDRTRHVGEARVRVEHRVVDLPLAVRAGHRVVEALPLLRPHRALIVRGGDAGAAFSVVGPRHLPVHLAAAIFHGGCLAGAPARVVATQAGAVGIAAVVAVAAEAGTQGLGLVEQVHDTFLMHPEVERQVNCSPRLSRKLCGDV